MVHAHHSELDAIYAFNSQPSQCLYYVIIQIIGAGVSLYEAISFMNKHYEATSIIGVATLNNSSNKNNSSNE